MISELYEGLAVPKGPQSSTDAIASELHTDLMLLETYIAGAISCARKGVSFDARYLHGDEALLQRLEGIVADATHPANADARRYLDFYRMIVGLAAIVRSLAE